MTTLIFIAWTTHYNLVRDCLNAFHGHELKTIGDSFFAAFSRPDDAVGCAIEIQKRLTNSPIAVEKETLRVRIGVHMVAPRRTSIPCPVAAILSGPDVDKAARLESLARGGQVLISEETNTIGLRASCTIRSSHRRV